MKINLTYLAPTIKKKVYFTKENNSIERKILM